MEKKPTNANKDAFALFPNVLKSIPSLNKQSKTDKVVIAPPSPPDISWLKTDQYEDNNDNSAADVPTALVLMTGKKNKAIVFEALEELGYQIKIVNTPSKAIEEIQFSTIAILLQHTDFEAGTLSESILYNYLNELSMTKRRYIFYILTGPGFHTLYNLEALSNSANLVVNDRDLKYLRLILTKSFHDFEDLFSNFLDNLSGKEYQ